MTTVPKLWPDSTIVCIGTGPSLTQADVDVCRDKARVIVVNNAYKLAPWADVMYACDGKFWIWEKGAPSFHGLKYSLQTQSARWKGVQIIKNLGRDGLTLDPTGVKTGCNSGYQAINLAVHLGASRILLLGYDMSRSPKGRSHYFGEHPDKTQPPYAACLKAFATLVAPLKAANIEIVNCTRSTALRCFPIAQFEDALMERAA